MTEHSGCDEVRLALGVYVVGAIEPAERSIVDAHLNKCADCRQELAGLAGLPALLGRVPADNLEQLAAGVTRLPGPAEPPPELLSSLLQRVAARRRAHRWRTAVISAAAAVIVVGGGIAAGAVLHGGTSGPAVPNVAASAKSGFETEQNTDPHTHVTAVVAYHPSSWGTSMKVWVKGVPPGATCEFWVVSKDGGRSPAGGWTERAGQRDVWYSISSPVTGSHIKNFQLTSHGKILVTIPSA